MTLVEFFVVFFLITWFILTAIVQFWSSFSELKVIRFLDQLAIIPRWTFFAPNPGTVDYHLLYRNQCSNGDVTNWKEVPFNSRTSIEFLWHPDKRQRKALGDCVNELIEAYKKSGSGVRLSVSYMLLLNFVTNCSQHADAQLVQFVVMQKSNARETIELTFTSELHKLV